MQRACGTTRDCGSAGLMLISAQVSSAFHGPVARTSYELVRCLCKVLSGCEPAKPQALRDFRTAQLWGKLVRGDRLSLHSTGGYTYVLRRGTCDADLRQNGVKLRRVRTAVVRWSALATCVVLLALPRWGLCGALETRSDALFTGIQIFNLEYESGAWWTWGISGGRCCHWTMHRNCRDALRPTPTSELCPLYAPRTTHCTAVL
ncbi:hypothetical protein OH77DRAFT_621440 [Trametes cingulata]|nr:hypothetical protein OH77DRAFT_621440 [Trametes cingulata]